LWVGIIDVGDYTISPHDHSKSVLFNLAHFGCDSRYTNRLETLNDWISFFARDATSTPVDDVTCRVKGTKVATGSHVSPTYL
jgi:hypothetical protein